MKYSIFKDPDFVRFVCGNNKKEMIMGNIVLSLYDSERYHCDIGKESKWLCVDCREWLEKALADENKIALCELAEKIILSRHCEKNESQITI